MEAFRFLTSGGLALLAATLAYTSVRITRLPEYRPLKDLPAVIAVACTAVAAGLWSYAELVAANAILMPAQLATVSLLTLAYIGWAANLVAVHATQLETRSAELARSNSDLEQFAYVASHDLKEPLRMVSSYVKLLEQRYKGRLDDRADLYIGFAVEGTTRMHQLIDGLLEYSRIGTRPTTFAPVPLRSVVDEACMNLKMALDEKKARVEIGDLPTVHGDRRQLVQLVQNLVANAIKFHHPERAPLVRIGARRDGQEHVVFVADEGIGIDPEYHDQLFALFRRLHPREEYPGNGLGLAVCKRVAERHGGRIWIESALGKGTTFLVSLPGARA